VAIVATNSGMMHLHINGVEEGTAVGILQLTGAIGSPDTPSIWQV
jgi:hypothetical protein